jgi:hypothetical protein
VNFKIWLNEWEGFTFPGTSEPFVNDPPAKSRYRDNKETEKKTHIANFGFKKEDLPLMKRHCKKMKR